jgi:transcriptional regulator with XRE-family HTH domain
MMFASDNLATPCFLCQDVFVDSNIPPRVSGPARAERPRVGCAIRRWRRDRGLTLAQVAERAGLNTGYLSQIENDKASPSLDCLAAIGTALEVPVGWFLVDSSPPMRVVRRSERRARRVPLGGQVEEVDGGIPRGLRILHGRSEPGSRTGHHAHPGDEHHVILAGRWRFTQGDQVVEVGPGDYVLLDGTVPHDVEVVGDEPGEVLVIGARQTSWTPDAG